MTSPISGMSGITGADPTAGAAASGATDKSQDLGDKDTFLKLLVAQLKYQDPTSPADSTQFLAQTAQFTQVEKLDGILTQLKSQQLIGASALVGRTVNYMDPTGAHLTGVVSSAKLNGDSEPTLKVGNTDVPLSKVMEVQTIAQQDGEAPPPQPMTTASLMTPAKPASTTTTTAPPADKPAVAPVTGDQTA